LEHSDPEIHLSAPIQTLVGVEYSIPEMYQRPPIQKCIQIL
jgi:hypothetical protein